MAKKKPKKISQKVSEDIAPPPIISDVPTTASAKDTDTSLEKGAISILILPKT